MNENVHSEQSEENLVEFLLVILAEFHRGGWGQSGSITEFGVSGEFRHKVNSGEPFPVLFIDSFSPTEKANALLVHWEYWPPPELIHDDPTLEIFRTVLWVDREGRHLAIFCGDDPAIWTLGTEAFPDELELLARKLDDANCAIDA